VGATAAGTNYLGFNSGSTLPDRSAKFKKDYVAEMKTAQGLNNAPGTFNSIRLYTNIQAYSQDDPIQAFEAAIETKTNLLLGVWASGTDNIDKELSALQKAVKQYGSKFTDLVIGISIGSEDLYRDSVTGIKNKAGVGNSPDTIVKFIGDYKKAFKDNALSKVPVGHVDTWDVWTNSSIKPVIDAVDWVGVDEYPYYENGKGNSIKRSGNLFDRAFDATVAAVNGKPVWLTETGWPYTGPNWDEAVASVENAKYYWDEVGCRKLFNKVPTFWYNLRDSNPDNTMKFAITKDLSTKPLFDLTCPKSFETKDEATASGSGSTATNTGASKPTATGSNAGSNTNGGSDSSTTSPAPAATTTKGNGASVDRVSGSAFFALAVLTGAMALL
jgi:glucan endo-1,3-beta-D-glucosidase